ncbi:coiled-coil domain-containing protein 6 [Paragonimus westermani]|uniref:Coiled-coil domain-containing protein 6 n=1 Tax=Paragonimus westermani TaxID=34504 RepID=A0A5J4NNE8_9TREM|nr:coiled-coil domain-containing protein 6 [Paragonimus westermani]
MADSAFEVDLESDASSVEGSKDNIASNEQLLHRVQSLQQENRVLKTEVETLKLKIKGLNEVNQQLRRNSVNIQAKAEQEEEYISNTLLKKITELKKEKESLAINYEQEEECLTNELNRKFTQLRQEKVALERTLAREQEDQVSKLKLRIEKLEADMNNKQGCLDRLRREKIELENALEQEQEALVNRLWKKMEKLESEKRILQEKLESLGTLLSGSSSNQSLASATNVSTCGNGSMLGDPSGLINSGPVVVNNRPTRSGPGSLRGSLRGHNHLHIVNCVGSAQVSSKPVTSTSGQACLNVPVVTDSRSHQLNQSSSTHTEPTLPKPSTGDSCMNVAPPQSPMDVDVLDHSASGSISPRRISGPTGQLTKGTIVSGVTPKADQVTLPSVPINETPVIWDSHITAPYVNRLREEVCHLRRLLERQEAENASRMPLYESEERSAAEENRRLRKLLQVEKERREALSRQLSESESSLEMEDERQFNEACRNTRLRTTSDSTSPFHPPGPTAWSIGANPSAIYGPGHAYATAVAASFSGHASLGRCCRECGQRLPPPPVPPSDDWPTSVSATGCTSARGQPNSLYTSVGNHAAASRVCPCPFCSPSTSPGKPCNVHHIPLPNSPSTPTTSSGTGASGSQPFAKPLRRVPMVHSSSDRANVNNDTSSRDLYFAKRLSSYSSNEQLFVDVEGADCQTADPDDDDEDARCVTPPVCQPDSTESN